MPVAMAQYGSSSVRVQPGDILWHEPADISPGQRGFAQMVMSPIGWSQGNGATLTTNAVVTAGSPTVTWTTMTPPLVNDNLILVGAGVGGVNLNVIVTAVDWNGLNMTVSPTPSTSVNPATISFQTPIVQEIGMDATRMSAAPTSGTWYTGNIVWNSAPVANGILLWICTASGTPGTWTPVYGPSSPSATVSTSAPLWLQYLGTGADGAISCTGNVSNVEYATTFTVPLGQTCTVNTSTGLTVHATGACTINGTLLAQSNAGTSGALGGSGGGGGGGTGAGTAGTGTIAYPYVTSPLLGGGTAGTASGGAGGTGNAESATQQRQLYQAAGLNDGLLLGGDKGGAGGSTGGAGGTSGGSVVLICGSITGTGTINASGIAGTAAPGNNTGGGGGGGGGVVILSSQATEGSWPTISVSGGTGGSCGIYSGCGAGGTGGAGWYATFSGW